MKLSIKRKLFVAIGGLILLFVMLSWLLNNFFLDRYYLYSKKISLIDCFRQINSIYNGDPEVISLELEKFESTKGMHIVILNEDYSIKYVFNQRLLESLQRRYNPRMMLNGLEIHDLIGKSKTELVLRGEIVIETGNDKRLNSNFINLFSRLNNGDFVVINASVTAIQESAEVANKFYLFTGLLTILVGFALVYLITGRFTEPILELNSITKRMSKLDFSKRYTVKSNDEIGQLGSSINSLSEQLEKSIFELREANKKLMRDIEKERKIDEMRKEFISNVSHELKTPIALIQGYAEGLKVNVNDDEENKNFYCDIIMSESLKMNKLVKELLELSKLDSGMIRLERTDFNISELADCVMKKSSIIIKEKGIQAAVDIEGDTAVNADFDRAEQVLTNFINNAIEHIDDKKIISLSTKRTGEKIRIEVFNSGKHISEEDLDKIWLSFYKADKARTRELGGTGLGLSIVKAIQEAHNNKYGVENIENGVVFWFELDMAK